MLTQIHNQKPAGKPQNYKMAQHTLYCQHLWSISLSRTHRYVTGLTSFNLKSTGQQPKLVCVYSMDLQKHRKAIIFSPVREFCILEIGILFKTKQNTVSSSWAMKIIFKAYGQIVVKSLLPHGDPMT